MTSALSAQGLQAQSGALDRSAALEPAPEELFRSQDHVQGVELVVHDLAAGYLISFQELPPASRHGHGTAKHIGSAKVEVKDLLGVTQYPMQHIGDVWSCLVPKSTSVFSVGGTVTALAFESGVSSGVNEAAFFQEWVDV